MHDLKVDPALDAIRCPECSSIIRLIRMGNTVLNRYMCPDCGKEVVLSGRSLIIRSLCVKQFSSHRLARRTAAEIVASAADPREYVLSAFKFPSD